MFASIESAAAKLSRTSSLIQITSTAWTKRLGINILRFSPSHTKMGEQWHSSKAVVGSNRLWDFNPMAA